MKLRNKFPYLHNAGWPGVVGKGPGQDQEPVIDLDTMLDLTAAAEVDGVKFDGFDLFLFDPHVSIDASDDEIKTLADQLRTQRMKNGGLDFDLPEIIFMFDPSGGQLLAMEMFPDDSVDPCEIYFSDYRPIGEQRLPNHMQVRHGDRIVAEIQFKQFTLVRKPGE